MFNYTIKQNIMEQISFKIIAACGEANAEIHLALNEARYSNFEQAIDHLKCADEFINNAHVAHTSVLHGEAKGDKAEYSILFSHAQDTMMNVMTLRGIADEFISIYKKIN